MGEGGRIVWNHSTHLSGLVPVLKRLAACEGVRTVTPGELGRAKGHRPKLQLKVSVPIHGGFKAIARNGKSVQEVFIVTELSREGLQAAIARAIAR